MINRIIVGGRLTADPELRRTESGKAVCSFTIACERDFKNQGGERDADFISCVAWNNTAEFISRYFSKGRMAIVDGRLQVRNYTDKEGNRRYKSEVVAGSVYFGDYKKQDTAPDVPDDPGPKFHPAGGPVSVDCGQDFDEVEPDGDLPF